MNYYVSDLHFGHKTVIYYGNRPYQTTEEMDEDLIARWNKKVGKFDTVYIVGDFTLKKEPSYINGILDRLNGEKVLITGNHDLFIKHEECRSRFKEITPLLTMFAGREPWLKQAQKVTLCHYALVEWPGSRREPDDPQYGYLIYGHAHGSINPIYRTHYLAENAFNAGADVNGLEPVTMDELIKNNADFRKKALEQLKDLNADGLYGTGP